MADILLVEDDTTLALVVQKALVKQSHAVQMVDTGVEGLEQLRVRAYDVAVIDWNLPLLSGIDVCVQYRQGGGQTPILMLTGRKEPNDKTSGFDAGADDYLTKPFLMEELVLRIRALLKRAKQIEPHEVIAGDVKIDCLKRCVTRQDRQIAFEPREMALLIFLVRHRGVVFSPEEIVNAVWESESEMSPESVRTFIARVRKKIDSDHSNSLIKTVHGIGYRFSTE